MKVQYTHRPTERMGRFGGEWQWNVGVQAGHLSRRHGPIIVNLLVGRTCGSRGIGHDRPRPRQRDPAAGRQDAEAKREEAARRAVSTRKQTGDELKAREAAKPNRESATVDQLRTGLDARDRQAAKNPRARAAVRKAQVSEAVKARFSDQGIGGGDAR
ncbi:hypothetical protein [Capillimicrobium parvum]|uniref:Uncharacterized protein n=1 Tax=Capillimicrobium parvum TaxID=2884022 RepID=A0A9E6XVI2_9ACTN|nr:hypothetical protein [Capillimicrobium parvum]UGS34536.1 hypothetical protein DSM104329_00914 [Capillimicrobium parvum]